jgi:electron transfer flavoprotein beta subunit
MNILVCVKEVIDPDSPLVVGDDGTIDTLGKITLRMNRYDEFALEEAVLIKEELPDVTVTALTVGPPGASDILRRALGKGADHACHMIVPGRAFMPPLIRATLISGYAREKNFDLVFTGVMAEDDQYCQTGPLIAAVLDMPCAVSVMARQIDSDNKKVLAECEIEGGIRERVAMSMPCLMAVQSGINRPRYPSLSNTLRAKGQAIEEIAVDPSTVRAQANRAGNLSYPPARSRGAMLEGTREEKARKLLDILHEQGLI